MTTPGFRLVRRYTPGTPIRSQNLAPPTVEETQELTDRKVLLSAALAGNELAKARLRERGLVRWWREGKWVMGEPNGG